MAFDLIKVISFKNFKVWIIVWMSSILLMLFGIGLYTFKINLQEVNFKQIAVEKEVKKESIDTNIKSIIVSSSEILETLSRKFSKDWGNKHLSESEKVKKLKDYWNNSFLSERNLEIIYYGIDFSHHYISDSYNPFSKDSILSDKILSNYNNLSRGANFFYCEITCQLYIVRPLSTYNFKSGMIQASISIDQLMRNINKEVYKADFFALRKTENITNAIYINGGYYMHESSSNFRKEKDFFLAVENKSEKIEIWDGDYISRHNDLVRLISIFDYGDVIIVSMRDITSFIKKSEGAFNVLIRNAILFLLIVIMASYLLLSISVKRIIWLNEILHLLELKKFDSARALIGKKIRASSFDEIDEIYNSTFSLTNELERTLLEISQKNIQLTKKIKEIRFLAEHDPLTGLFNRRRFNKGLDEIVKKKRVSI